MKLPTGARPASKIFMSRCQTEELDRDRSSHVKSGVGAVERTDDGAEGITVRSSIAVGEVENLRFLQENLFYTRS